MAKSLIIIAGPNGAGKTTFARDYLREYPHSFLSADDLAARLSPKQPDLAKIEAGRQFSRQLRESIQIGRNIVVESTLSGLSMQRILRQAKEAGFAVVIVFIFLESPEACVRRVKERVRKGGHDVPESDILRRFYRSGQNFWNIYREEAAAWFLFYNSGAVFQPVVFGDAETYKVMDEELFNLFSEIKT